MQQKDFNQFFSSDFSKSFFQNQSFPFDMKTLLEAQRKNFQALSEAQQITAETAQAIAQRNSEIFSQFMADQSEMAKQVMGEGAPEDKISKQTEMMKKTYEHTIQNLKDLGEMISKSQEEASELINKRMSATFSELKSSIKQGKKAA